MPRIPRGQAAGYVYHIINRRGRYHIINRGNGRTEIFHKSQDYQAFLDLLSAAKKRQPVKVLAFCLMPNHFHLALEPTYTTALSKFMQEPCSDDGYPWLLSSGAEARKGDRAKQLGKGGRDVENGSNRQSGSVGNRGIPLMPKQIDAAVAAGFGGAFELPLRRDLIFN